MKNLEIPDQKQKIALPDDIFDLIKNIVQEINHVKDVVEDVHNSDYKKAVTDLLLVVEGIVVDMILPRVLKQSEADNDGHDDDQPKQGQ